MTCNVASPIIVIIVTRFSPSFPLIVYVSVF
jgi:hypothetical protein